MTYWHSETERDVVTRLAAGERWVLTSDQKSALFAGIETEEFHNRHQAEKELKKAAAKLREERTHRAQMQKKHLMLSNAHAHVAALYSPRWDAYAKCIDCIYDPPKPLTEQQVITHTAFWQLTACFSRRNATLANYLTKNVFPHHKKLVQTQHTQTLIHPPYQPVVSQHTEITNKYIDELSRYVTADTPYGGYAQYSVHAAKMVLVYAQEHPEELMGIVRKCKVLLRMELQKGEGERDKRYWLPISRPDVQVASQRARLSQSARIIGDPS